jgi:hypothetical protein
LRDKNLLLIARHFLPLGFLAPPPSQDDAGPLV